LPRRWAENLSPKSRHVKAGTTGGHHLNGTTGNTEGEGPERIDPSYVDEFVSSGKLNN